MSIGVTWPRPTSHHRIKCTSKHHESFAIGTAHPARITGACRLRTGTPNRWKTKSQPKPRTTRNALQTKAPTDRILSIKNQPLERAACRCIMHTDGQRSEKKKARLGHKASHVNSNSTSHAQRAVCSDPTTRVGLSPAFAVTFPNIHPLRKNFLVFRLCPPEAAGSPGGTLEPLIP